MSLLFYFHVAPQVLSDPAGPLSAELSPSTIAEANTAVNSVWQAKTKGGKKRGTYIKYDEKMKIKMGKYSSEMGSTRWRGTSSLSWEGISTQALFVDSRKRTSGAESETKS